ncbi:GDP-D-glucose phosphorylase 1 [Alligator sinensis]|uniref:GDP-D-glucose phosphorylase 1 n=1 Tax=Alligator sinensis TaxID=38654 RepID=A0A3Q0H9K4_ALLSI|nr:GDP-D-glucose phosphorylase 1 [Alligator sinensis]
MLHAQERPEHPAASGLEDFVYSEEDFVLQGVGWGRSRPDGLASRTVSRFDHALQSGWERRMKQGLFRYPLGELQTRILPGEMHFVAQLNIQRGLERRKPQDIQSVRQRFDPQQFHFSKIKPGEILFCLTRSHSPHVPAGGQAPAQDGAEPRLPETPNRVLVVINVSPLEFGHVLLIPDPMLCLPQVLTQELLHFGLEAVLLSTHPGFRVGFNSLGALASVNHLHLHGFYLDWELLIESAPSKPLCPALNFHLLQGVPAPGFLFYDEGRGLGVLARAVCRVTDYLVENEIAHNVFVTRGTAPGEPARSAARSGVRVVVWARKSCFGAKEEAAFNVALCELAGHLPVKTAQDFQSLTESSALHTIQKYLLPAPQLSWLQDELVTLLTG